MGGGDHAEFMAFTRRILRAASRRMALADPEDLADLVALRAAVDEAIDNAARSVHANGATWEQIGAATGTTKQAAHKRWGRQPRVDHEQAVTIGR
ncbi:hypothetical protein EXU48_15740 [Occultella glacieicola]|uniref:Uncharacterized protein n=1 Tax=Occultella glacieicola TaxID=2518684 RepID=A0ABY2E0Z1_9MICO|nr:hypothetical protein [Occultella glacieicola]TDE91596.1 hypothetical protein EXU48_15740 [Occultella glacieicola]